MRMARTGTVDVVVDVGPHAVWRVIADVTRTGQWSHECHTVRWLDGITELAPGARFRGSNRAGRMRWSRACEVVAVDAPRELVWRTKGLLDSTEWRLRVEPAGDGSRITESYQIVALPRWMEWVILRAIPAHTDRSAALSEDLQRLGALAAAESGAPPSR